MRSPQVYQWSLTLSFKPKYAITSQALLLMDEVMLMHSNVFFSCVQFSVSIFRWAKNHSDNSTEVRSDLNGWILATRDAVGRQLHSTAYVHLSRSSTGWWEHLMLCWLNWIARVIGKLNDTLIEMNSFLSFALKMMFNKSVKDTCTF